MPWQEAHPLTTIGARSCFPGSAAFHTPPVPWPSRPCPSRVAPRFIGAAFPPDFKRACFLGRRRDYANPIPLRGVVDPPRRSRTINPTLPSPPWGRGVWGEGALNAFMTGHVQIHSRGWRRDGPQSPRLKQANGKSHCACRIQTAGVWAAGRSPSASTVDVMPSTRRYCSTDGRAAEAAYRCKDNLPVRIRGASAAKEGAFGTVSRSTMIMRLGSNPKAGPCSNGRADQCISHRWLMPVLLGNAKDVFARQRLLTRFLPKRNSVVV